MTDGSAPVAARLAVRWLAAYALFGGLISFAGWVANLARLTDWDGDGISIQPNATVAAIGSGAALLLLGSGRRKAAAALGILVSLIGATALFQYVSGVDIPGLNTLLMFDRTFGRVGVVS